MRKHNAAVYAASVLILGGHIAGYAASTEYTVTGGQVDGVNAIAVGASSNVNAVDGLAIGYEATTSAVSGVALGSGSIADRVGKSDAYIGYNPMSNTHYKVGEAGADNPKLEDLYEKIRQANYKVLIAEEEIERAESKKEKKESDADAAIAAANAQKAKADQDLVDAEKAYADAIKEANEAGNASISSAWNATDGAVSVGGNKAGVQHTRQITNVAAGYEDTDAATVGQLKVLRNRVEREKPRYISIKSRDLGVDSNEKNNGATKEGAIAIGPRAQSKSENAIAIGRNVQIGENSKNTVAIGKGISETGIYSVNIGEGTRTAGVHSTAVGTRALAANSSLAIGASSTASADNTVAVGRTTTAIGVGATAIGDSAHAEGSQSVSVGYSAYANDFAAIAVGGNTKTYGNGAIAIGHGSEVGESGKNKEAYAGVSLGLSAKTFVRHGVALGGESYADRGTNDASTNGYDAALHGPHFSSAAFASANDPTWKATNSAVSVGDRRPGYRKTRQIINVAAGGEDTDAVNVAQLKALEKRNTILAGNDVPFNADGTVATTIPDTRVYTPGDKEIKIQGKANTVYGVAPQAGAKAPDGKSEYAAPTLYSSDNLITYKDPMDSILRIGMLKTPTFTGVHFDNPLMNISLGSNDRGHLTLTTGGKDGSSSTTSPVLTVDSLKEVLKPGKGISITTNDGGEYGKTYTFSLDKDQLKGDPDFKGDKGDKGDPGAVGAKGDQGIQGEKGETGAKGDTGADGKSAFEVWKGLPGNESKTEADFIKAITGEKGKDGAVGHKGEKGEAGATGAVGPKGDKGETGVVGPKGDKGDAGKAGKDGAKGKSAYEYWKEIKGNENKTEDDFRKSLEGGAKENTRHYEELERQIGVIGNDLQELRKESREGDALGAALAALKPIQYDPLEPTQFMAGIGHYKNANALALGIAHYTKESTMFHAGVSMVRGATMINGGATFKFGNSPEKKAVPERYRNGPISSVLVLHDEMVAMKEAYGREITVLTQENNNLRQDIATLQEQMQELRAMVRK